MPCRDHAGSFLVVFRKNSNVARPSPPDIVDLTGKAREDQSPKTKTNVIGRLSAVQIASSTHYFVMTVNTILG